MAWVLFFDGDCAFCSASVRRAMSFDREGRLDFAPLQGKFASEMGLSGNAASKNGTMILLRESDGKIFDRSDALIELARVLGGWWRLTTIARFIPKFLRDAVYRWIADHRHRFMGKSASCSLPDPELVKRLRE
jgi:predicted DCC family thiol-disulfide oxidoreductase YuxK